MGKRDEFNNLRRGYDAANCPYPWSGSWRGEVHAYHF